MTPIGGTMAELRRAIDDLRRIVEKPPHFANLRDGGNLPAKRPGLIRYSLALAILPSLFWFAPDIMRAIGRVW